MCSIIYSVVKFCEQGIYRSRVDEYKRELARVDETMSFLANQYISSRLKSTAAARRPRQSTAATSLWGTSEVTAGVVGDMGADYSGPPSRNGGGVPRLLTAQADAVKDEADELLQAYAHVLGGDAGRDSSATTDTKME